MEEMFELLADEDKGNPEKPNLAQQLTNFRQEWHHELGKAPRGPGDSRGSPAPGPVQRIGAASASIRSSEKNVNAVKGQEQRNDAGTAPVKSSGDARSNSASPSPELEDERDVEISSLLTESIEEKVLRLNVVTYTVHVHENCLKFLRHTVPYIMYNCFYKIVAKDDSFFESCLLCLFCKKNTIL